jgi:hypothetical protein
MIKEILPSERANKRLKAILSDNRVIHFGQKNGFTYIDEADKTKRFNYHARHMANNTERELITTLTPSPALFASMILWGKYKTIDKNKDLLNKLFRMKQAIN